MKQIILKTAMALLLPTLAYAENKDCINESSTGVELCYNWYDLYSAQTNDIVEIQLIESEDNKRTLSATVIDRETLKSEKYCNTLDVHTSYALKVKGLSRIFQFGYYRKPRCKEGDSTSVLLFSGDETAY